MTEKLWALPELDQIQVKSLVRQMNVSMAVASVYLVRGLDTPDKVEEFCNPNINELHDSYLLPDMKKAVDRIIEALRDNEKIMIVGDADCDGISATALVVYALRAMGADVIYRIPNRLTDGFGIKTGDVELALEKSVGLVITVDNGIDSYRSAEIAKKIFIDLIITDHHEPSSDGTLPSALAVVNPKRHDSIYPFDGLSGVGIAFKLMLAVAEKIGCNRESIINQLIEFVALGTVADMMPMLGENRILVSQGCQALTDSCKPGIHALLSATRIKVVDSNSIGFYIAPLINASARLGQPELAVELLLADNKTDASRLARRLIELNEERKRLQADMTIEILQAIPKRVDDPIIFSSGRNRHLGLLGLAANTLTDIFNRPAFVCSIQDDGTVRGSARCPKKSFGLTAVKEIQEEHNIMENVGGHEEAFGWMLRSDDLPFFRELLIKHASEHYDYEDTFLEIDARLPIDEIHLGTYQQLTKLAPYGNRNPEPMFLTERLSIENSVAIADGRHLKLQLRDSAGRKAISGIYWRMGDSIDLFQRGKIVDVVYSLGVNDFAGRKEIMLTIEDIQATE